MKNSDFKYMKEALTADLIDFLMKDYKLYVYKAFDILYESETYGKLCNPSTGLYFQGSLYVYSYLREELNKGMIAEAIGYRNLDKGDYGSTF